jgi:hypothetical protein
MPGVRRKSVRKPKRSMKKTMRKPKRSMKKSVKGGKRKLSPYNKFVKAQMKKGKSMKEAAKMWSASKK